MSNSLNETEQDAFTWVNQGSATVARSGTGVYLSAPAGANDSLRIRKKPPHRYPAWRVTACMQPLLTATYNNFGICCLENPGDKLVAIQVYLYTDYGTNISLLSFNVYKYASPTSAGTAYLTSFPLNQIMAGGFIWLRMEDTGTELVSSFGVDGTNFREVHRVSRTDYLTAGANEVGYYANAFNATYPAGVRLLSWGEI